MDLMLRIIWVVNEGATRNVGKKIFFDKHMELKLALIAHKSSKHKVKGGFVIAWEIDMSISKQ